MIKRLGFWSLPERRFLMALLDFLDSPRQSGGHNDAIFVSEGQKAVLHVPRLDCHHDAIAGWRKQRKAVDLFACHRVRIIPQAVSA
jgi:hypothetical protein